MNSCATKMYKIVKGTKYCLGSSETCAYYVEVGDEKECYSTQCPEEFKFQYTESSNK